MIIYQLPYILFVLISKLKRKRSKLKAIKIVILKKAKLRAPPMVDNELSCHNVQTSPEGSVRGVPQTKKCRAEPSSDPPISGPGRPPGGQGTPTEIMLGEPGGLAHQRVPLLERSGKSVQVRCVHIQNVGHLFEYSQSTLTLPFCELDPNVSAIDGCRNPYTYTFNAKENDTFKIQFQIINKTKNLITKINTKNEQQI